MTDSPRTSYDRAVARYDEQFKDALVIEIITTIGTTSIVDVNGTNVMAIRTGETLEALSQCLIATATLCPTFDTPSELRKFSETLAKRVRKGVAHARANPPPEANRFFGFRKEGNA